MPNTPIASFRIPEELRLKAVKKAQEEGTTLTALIIAWLKDYTK